MFCLTTTAAARAQADPAPGHAGPGLRRVRRRVLRAWAAASALALGAAACGGSAATTAAASASAQPSVPGCSALRSQYPELVGRTLTDALTPFTPGYESADPNNPSTYVGFDVDLLHQLGSCLGFSSTFKPTAFSALIPTLQAGQANIVISDIYATPQRAKAATFVTYEKVNDGFLVRAGNPRGITGFNLHMCGATAAENTGFVEVPLVENLAGPCQAAGKPAPKLLLFSNNADCIQAVLAGRADVYVNDVNTVNQAVKAHPGQLANSTKVTLPYSVGIALPKGDARLILAIKAALTDLQAAGVEKRLLAKWGLDAGTQETPTILGTV